MDPRPFGRTGLSVSPLGLDPGSGGFLELALRFTAELAEGRDHGGDLRGLEARVADPGMEGGRP